MVSLLALARIGFCITESASYEAAFVISPSGSGILTSNTYSAQSVFGQDLVGSSEVPGAFDVYFGSMAVYEITLPPPDEYDIYDIQAFSLSTRLEVPEAS